MKNIRKQGRILAVGIALGCGGLMPAQTPPVAPAGESPAAQFERRIATRATNLLERLKPEDAAVAAKVREAVLRFYRDLHAAHTARDTALGQPSAGDHLKIHHALFEADKQSHEVQGRLIGSLSSVLNEAQVDAVKDWMTFDMVALSVAEYGRMFPAMTARQKEQLRAWLVESREAAVIAGSSETKLDVFRVNKLRMHAYLAAQGFDVETAVKAEAARKAAETK